MFLRIVVFPAPFRPIRADDLSFVDRERDVLDHVALVVEGVDILDGKQGHSSSPRVGLFDKVIGLYLVRGPSAINRPWFRTRLSGPYGKDQVYVVLGQDNGDVLLSLEISLMSRTVLFVSS